MGDIPSAANMVTTIILSPAPGEDVEPNKDFEIKLRIGNLAAGSFTNPQVTYYSAPQRLDNTGRIIGHVHVRTLCQRILSQCLWFLANLLHHGFIIIRSQFRSSLDLWRPQRHQTQHPSFISRESITPRMLMVTLQILYQVSLQGSIVCVPWPRHRIISPSLCP